jgi:isoleucyl-tRNA synthetase
MGFEVLDKISVEVLNENETVTKALTDFGEYITTETQAVSLKLRENLTGATEVEMDDLVLKLKIEKR